MAASTTNINNSCHSCRTHLPTGEAIHLGYTSHRFLCKKCDDVAKEKLGTTSDQHLEPLTCTRSNCKILGEDTTSAPEHLIALTSRVEELEEVNAALQLSQHSSAASSSAASSTRDRDHDYSICQASKPSSQPLSPREKAENFIKDDTGLMNLHGLTTADLNSLLIEDKNFFQILLNKIHVNLSQYNKDKTQLPSKYLYEGESRQKFLDMVLLAANKKAVKNRIGLALYYQAYASELGLYGSEKKLEAFDLYQQARFHPESKYYANSRLAFLFLKRYLSNQTHLIKPEEHRYFMEVTDFLFDASTAHNLNIENTPIDDGLFTKTCFIYKRIKGIVNQDDCNDLIELAKEGDGDALCLLLDFFLFDASAEIPKGLKFLAGLEGCDAAVREFYSSCVTADECTDPFESSRKEVEMLAKTKLIIQAQVHHHPNACALLGYCYFKNKFGLNGDIEEVKSIFEVGINNESPECSFWLAQLLKFDPEENKRVMELLKFSLSKGFDLNGEAKEAKTTGKRRPLVLIEKPTNHYFI